MILEEVKVLGFLLTCTYFTWFLEDTLLLVEEAQSKELSTVLHDIGLGLNSSEVNKYICSVGCQRWKERVGKEGR